MTVEPIPEVVTFLDAAAYAKTLCTAVANVLIRADGDRDFALALLATIDVADLKDPGLSGIAKSICEQAIREAAQ